MKKLTKARRNLEMLSSVPTLPTLTVFTKAMSTLCVLHRPYVN